MNYALYLKRLFSIFGVLLALNLASFVLFIYNPQVFYFRPWEYFPEVAYRFAEYEPYWDRIETSDQTRDNFFYYQDPHHTTVSVDADGYRKNRAQARKYDVMVSGDSAIFGSGLSDEETLPWRLAEKIDRPIFNGGRSSLFNTLKRPELDEVQLVVDMRTEREIRGEVFNSYGITEDSPYEPQLKNDKKLYELPMVVSDKRFLFTSIAFRTALRFLNDARVFLSGGPKRHIFRRHTVVERDLESATNAIVRRNLQMRALGIDYIFIGIPAKQTLYHAGIDKFTRNYLNLLTDRLRDANVETVNLLDPFLADESPGLYHNYDTHWNGRGTDLAAAVIADYLAARETGGRE